MTQAPRTTGIDDCGGVMAVAPGNLEPPARERRRLFEDGVFFHADGRAKFIFEEPRELPEPVDEEFLFTLLNGTGNPSQWHTQTRTAKSGRAAQLYPLRATSRSTGCLPPWHQAELDGYRRLAPGENHGSNT